MDVIKNSCSGIINQIIVIIFSFFSRNVIIQYLGIEMLGVNSTFASIISTLSIAELGFQTAVVYSLYEPIQNKNINRINDILGSLRCIYNTVGCFFIIVSLLLCPFLSYILNGVSVTPKIYLYFILQALASACSYFFSYKRTVLYVNQKIYISKFIDTICLLFTNLLQIIVIICWKNYLLFLVLKIIQVYGANIWTSWICNNMYPDFSGKKLNRVVLKDLFNDVKNIFVGKIASYVYISTDNLVISIMLNTVLVGVYGNYNVISTSIRYMANAMLTPLAPFLGNFLAREENIKKRKQLFLLYSDIRFMVALVLVIPTIILMNDAIILWVGKSYLLSEMIVFLLGIDLYIHIVHSVSVDYINGLGLFQYDKYIEITAAVLNIVFSILLTAKFGVEGVLFGTVISQCFFWMGRSIIVYLIGMKSRYMDYLMYWVKNTAQMVLFITTLGCCGKVVNNMKLSTVFLVQFLQKGITCVGIIFLVIIAIAVFIYGQYKEVIGEIIKLPRTK